MFRHIRNIIFIFLGMVLVGYLALVCVYALPTKTFKKMLQKRQTSCRKMDHIQS